MTTLAYRMAVITAFRLSREQGRPAFVFRPRQVTPPYTVVFDEEEARTKCGKGGYARCDAAEEPQHGQ